MAREDIVLINEYAATGSAEAFSELVSRHAGMVFAVAKRITGNAQDAEDVAQECFWTLARSAGRLKPPVVPWLHRLATCRAINFLRQRNTTRWRRQQAADLPAPEPEQSLRQFWPQVDEALLKLPVAQRELLISHFLQGAGQTDLAAGLGVNQSTVSRRLEEAITALRAILSRRGLAMAGLVTIPALATLQAAEPPVTLVANLGRIALAGVRAKGAAAGLGAKGWLIAGSLAIAGTVAGIFTGWHFGAPAAAPASASPVQVRALPAFPLAASANGRYLVDRDGAPFLWVGDGAGSAIAMLTPGEMDQYFDNRQAKGFTVIAVDLIEHQDAVNAPKNIAGDEPFSRFLAPGIHDFTAPNEAYFQRADLFLRKAADRGMGVLLFHSCLGFDGGAGGWFTEMKANGPERVRAWGRWLGKRYQRQTNLIWVNGRDFLPEPADQWVVDEVAQGIRDGGAVQLMTVHLRRGQDPTETFGSRPWFDLASVFTGNNAANARPQPIQQSFHAEYARTPARPVFLNEGLPEFYPNATRELLRSQAYLPYVTGGCGQTFENLTVFYFGTPLYHIPAHTMSWQRAMDMPGAQDIARLATALRSLPWWKLEPDLGHVTLTAGFESGDAEIAAARAADGSLALVYVPATGSGVRSFTVALDRLAGPVTARWFNPTSGDYLPAAESPLPDRDRHAFTTPGDNGTGTNDWLLVLTASTTAH